MSLQRVQIVTVDPATRYVEFKLKDQVVVTTQVWEVPSFFRWPKEGEYWTVERTGNTWKLGDRMEDVHTVKPVTEVAAGEAKINTDRVIYTDDGARMAVVVGTPSADDTLKWSVADNAWIPTAPSGGGGGGGGITWYDFTSNLYPVGASDWSPGFSGAPQIGVANGVIFLRGSIELTGASGQGVTIVDSPVGALPAPYRPTANRFMTFFTSTFSDDPTEVGWQGALRLGSDGHLKLYTTLSKLMRNGARRPTSGFQPQDTILFDGLCCAV